MYETADDMNACGNLKGGLKLVAPESVKILGKADVMMIRYLLKKDETPEDIRTTDDVGHMVVSSLRDMKVHVESPFVESEPTVTVHCARDAKC